MSGGTTNSLGDTAERYGPISRTFHWVTAHLLLWQFCMAIGWRALGEGNIMQIASHIGPAHASAGMLVLAIATPRILWALWNRGQRPAAEASLSGRLAKAVHTSFYILMFLVPLLALVRAYGSGKGYALWGFRLVPETGRTIAWLKAPADLLHAPLARMPSCLIAGHIGMALYHGIIRRDGTMGRMI